jgi:hypothetical protein
MRLLAGDRIQMKLVDIDQVQIMGDRDRIKQVILNLLANAVQYTQTNGVVTVALSKVEKQAQLIVQDNGPVFPLKTYRIYLSVFIAAKNPAGVQRAPALDWVSPLLTGSCAATAARSKWLQKKARERRLPYGFRCLR